MKHPVLRKRLEAELAVAKTEGWRSGYAEAAARLSPSFFTTRNG